jgi:hypothetical protein
MPRKTNDDIEIEIDIDPEDMYTLESDEERKEFVDRYTTSSFYDIYSPKEYDHDMDNYGYYDDYDR